MALRAGLCKGFVDSWAWAIFHSAEQNLPQRIKFSEVLRGTETHGFLLCWRGSLRVDSVHMYTYGDTSVCVHV